MSVDVAIIGAGTSGLNARRAAMAHGASVVMIDPGPHGTTCARVGCMPSKVLIAAAETMHHIERSETFGITVGDVTVDRQAVMARVQKLRNFYISKTIEFSVDPAHKDGTLIEEVAHFVDTNTLQVGDNLTVHAKAFVIATGSRPWTPPPFRALGDRLLTNEEIFELDVLPARLLVVGSGVIGMELGQAFSRLGTDVTIVELGDRIAGLADPHANATARGIFGAELDLHLGYSLDTIERDGDVVHVRFTGADGEIHEADFDYVLNAAGRRSNLDRVQIENAVPGDLPTIDPDTMRLGDTNIFVAGDATGTLAILHEAGHEGRTAGKGAASYPKRKSSPHTTPFGVVFTSPQIAQIGLGWEALDPTRHSVATLNLMRQGRLRALDLNQGVLRLYGDRETKRLVGATMVGHTAEHLAHLLAWSIEQELTVGQLLKMPFYHPVVEEALQGTLRGLAQAMRETAPGQACPTMGER